MVWTLLRGPAGASQPAARDRVRTLRPDSHPISGDGRESGPPPTDGVRGERWVGRRQVRGANPARLCPDGVPSSSGAVSDRQRHDPRLRRSVSADRERVRLETLEVGHDWPVNRPNLVHKLVLESYTELCGGLCPEDTVGVDARRDADPEAVEEEPGAPLTAEG
jgi:hypothetical protein